MADGADRTRMVIPRLHHDIPSNDRVRVFELLLRGQTTEAHELAAELEENRLRAIAHQLREKTLRNEFRTQDAVTRAIDARNRRITRERLSRRSYRAL